MGLKYIIKSQIDESGKTSWNIEERPFSEFHSDLSRIDLLGFKEKYHCYAFAVKDLQLNELAKLQKGLARTIKMTLDIQSFFGVK